MVIVCHLLSIRVCCRSIKSLAIFKTCLASWRSAISEKNNRKLESKLKKFVDVVVVLHPQ